MNEARTADEYARQKYAEKRKETTKQRNRDKRRYQTVNDNLMSGKPLTTVKTSNYFDAADKNKKEYDYDEYKKAARDKTGGSNTYFSRKYKSKSDAAYADDAIWRHNRRHPDRKLESAGTGIFGVKY